jgi:hypothetical protein
MKEAVTKIQNPVNPVQRVRGSYDKVERRKLNQEKHGQVRGQ